MQTRFHRYRITATIIAGLLVPGINGGDEPAHPQDVVATFKGHTDAIYAVAFTLDGKRVVTGSFDRTLRLWDVPDGKEVRAFGGPAGHQNLVLTAAFSPDGRTLASGGQDNQVRTWEVETGKPIKSIGHPNTVDSVAFQPNGSLLASGGHDGAIRIWDIEKGQLVRQINAHTAPAASPIYCVAWLPDGKQVASASLDRSVKLWDSANGNLVREFKPFKEKEFEQGHRDAVFCVAFSPDGKLMASGGSDRTVKLWNLADGTLLQDFRNPHLKPVSGASSPPGPVQSHPGWIHSLRFTPDGQRVVTVGNAPRNQGYLAIWAVGDGKLVHATALPFGPIYSVAVSPDGTLLALGCGPRAQQFSSADAYLLRTPGQGPN